MGSINITMIPNLHSPIFHFCYNREVSLLGKPSDEALAGYPVSKDQ